MKKVSEFMIADHSQLDEMYSNFLAEKDRDKSLMLFKKFKNHLLTHFEIEDTILFPIFDKHIGLGQSTDLTKSTNLEHKTLNMLLNKIEYCLETGNLNKAISIGNHFKRLLSKHDGRENMIQYSLFNNFITVNEKEWGEIIDKVKECKSKGDTLV